MTLVTGASGKNGSELVKTLTARGVKVRAMIHSGGRAGELPPGVEITSGDYAKRESLQPVLHGVDYAFLVSPMAEQAISWQMNFIQAAQRMGVKHVVRISVLGADAASSSRFHRSHAEVDEALKESALGWTILRPNFFMQTVPQYLQGDILYGIGGESRISVVDVRDIADVAAAALTEPGHHDGLTHSITGGEALSHRDMAERLAAATGRTIQAAFLAEEQAKTIMESAGFPAWNIEGILELSRWFQGGEAAVIASPAPVPRTFAQFAEEYAAGLQ